MIFIYIPLVLILATLVFLIIKCENFNFKEVNEMKNVDRGGIGSTGVKSKT